MATDDEEDDDDLTRCTGCDESLPIEELERCASCGEVWCSKCWTPRNDDEHDPCPRCVSDDDVIEEARHRY